MITKTYLTYNYKGQLINLSIWFTGSSKKVETIIFLGTVQIGKLPEWVAEECPPNTIVVQGSPHWHAKEDGSDIPEYMYMFTKEAFISILKNFSINKVKIIAESQAVPGVVRLFSLKTHSVYLESMVLIQPLGLNTHAFSGSDHQRIKLFKNRLIRNVSHQFLYMLTDKRHRYNYRQVSSKINFRNAVSRAQYSSGLMYDVTTDLKMLYTKNNNIIIFCGENDKVFIPAEIKENLRKQSIKVEVRTIPGVSHESLATKQGQKLLYAALGN